MDEEVNPVKSELRGFTLICDKCGAIGAHMDQRPSKNPPVVTHIILKCNECGNEVIAATYTGTTIL